VFDDRAEAGRRLAAALVGRVRPEALVLGVPRGGVVVAAEVARALKLDLDVIVVRKIGAPGNPEYAVGAVDEDGHVIGGRDPRVSEEYLEQAARTGREEIARRLSLYRGERPAPRIAGRDLIVVDDGIATGRTLLAALDSLRRRDAGSIMVAAPVASPDAAERIEDVADEFVALAAPKGFSAVGQFYREFGQTSDAEVVAILRQAWAQT